MTGRRVAITGIGIVSSLGVTREATWARMVEGACGIGPVSAFDATGYRSQIAGEVAVAIQQVSHVTEQSAAASEELASSSEELGAQAQSLRNLVSQVTL